MNFISRFFKGFWPGKKRIYLDYASATPLRREVFRAMEPYFSTAFGNASAIHEEGRIARKAIEEARTTLARTLRVQPVDITFTSGGTESNTLAILGTIGMLRSTGVAYEDMTVITTKIEHPSIIETLQTLSADGVQIAYAPIDVDGRIVISEFEKLLSKKTALVTCAYVNSEIGTIEEVKRLSRIVKKYNRQEGGRVRIHLDASQAPLWLPCHMDMLGVDMMTLDAGKCYGPKGGGVLVHRGVTLTPQMQGGGQEGGLRSGTENTALIVGSVNAIVWAQKEYKEASERITSLRDYALTEIAKRIPEAIVNGPKEGRVANNINISIPGYDSEYAVVVLDTKGISIGTKSACGSRDSTGSAVVRAIGDEARAHSTIRITIGLDTSRGELDEAITTLARFLKDMEQFTNA